MGRTSKRLRQRLRALGDATAKTAWRLVNTAAWAVAARRTGRTGPAATADADRDDRQGWPSRYALEPATARARQVEQGGGTRLEPSRNAGLTILALLQDGGLAPTPLIGQLAQTRQDFAADGLGFELRLGATRPVTGLPEWAEGIALEPACRAAAFNRLFDARPALDTLLLLDPGADLEKARGALRHLHRRLAQEPRLGLVGPLLLDPGRRVWHLGSDFAAADPETADFRPHAGSPLAPHRLGAGRWPAAGLSERFLMTRSELFARLGGLDPRYRREGHDHDFCLMAARLGYACEVHDAGEVVVPGGHPAPDPRDRALLLRRWSAFLAGGLRP